VSVVWYSEQKIPFQKPHFFPAGDVEAFALYPVIEINSFNTPGKEPFHLSSEDGRRTSFWNIVSCSELDVGQRPETH